MTAAPATRPSRRGRAFDRALPAVLLVHGAGMDHTVWQLPARWLAWHGHAVLAPSAIAASGQAAAFRMRPLAEGVLTSTLCMAVSAHKPATPLVKRSMRMLHELVMASVANVGSPRAHNRMR